MADGENGAGVAPVEGAAVRPEALGGGAPAGAAPAEPAKLPDLNGETWRLHLAGGDAELAKRFDRFTDPSALGKSVIEMEKRWSDPRTARLPQPLKENATDEEKAAHAKETRDFYSKIGVPESSDKYDIKIAEDAPETVKQGVEMIKAVGVDLGLTNEAANGLAAKLAEWQTQTDEAFEADAVTLETQRMDEIKSQWGADFDTNFKLANAAGAQFFGEGFKAFMDTRLADGTRLGTHPALIQTLASLAREFQGDPLFSKIMGGGESIEGIDRRIEEIRAYKDGTRAGAAKYDAATAELTKLMDTRRRLSQAAR